MDLISKLLLLSTTLICFKLSANTPYEIPRSSVIQLTEPSSKRVYSVYIQLPKSYKNKPDKTYPVIYLADAPYMFPIVAGATRFPMNPGKMQQAIIVAIGYEKGSIGSASRIRDYTPTFTKDWKKQTGNAQGHIKFIKNTVFPYIEQNYRASHTQKTYIGNSLGGLFGATILFTEPNLFSHYIIGSPSIWFDNNALLKFKAHRPKTAIKVYISVGEKETPAFGEGQNMVEGAKQLVQKIDALNSDNIQLKSVVIEGASHATAFPTTAIQGLDWVYSTVSE
ncbi:alpha/beta hydrolase [Pseudoalteromonas sp. SG43-3]|uniref:alpha/beta hydrolase n=1 Tax=Pseudoalteromonas sp. SG43-3 TaxID=2760970 RepID=UPI00160005E3|nr:alpha/beta hydrolase-fold protein [Pseudoalteromonas sp. SG43-3]MBB1444173.1 alpha/beta hydrolase [Pseudoalteromonas sp. SG43-3]